LFAKPGDRRAQPLKKVFGPLSLAALLNSLVSPATSDLALLNCPATCSSWLRNTPPASPPERISLASLRVSAPNALRSACASANCARNSLVSAVTETLRLSGILDYPFVLPHAVTPCRRTC
jgi:hypothetical protein